MRLNGRNGRVPGSRVPGLLTSKVLHFFDTNPGEELTYADAMAKFDVSRKTIHNTIARLKRQGEVATATVIRVIRKAA